MLLAVNIFYFVLDPVLSTADLGLRLVSLVSRNIIGVLLASHWHFIGILVVVWLTLALE